MAMGQRTSISTALPHSIWTLRKRSLPFPPQSGQNLFPRFQPPFSIGPHKIFDRSLLVPFFPDLRLRHSRTGDLWFCINIRVNSFHRYQQLFSPQARCLRGSYMCQLDSSRHVSQGVNTGHADFFYLVFLRA